MEKPRNDIVVAALILAAGLIVSTAIGACSALKCKSLEQSVFVTGAARKRITSDQGVWNVTVSREAPRIQGAYKLLSEDIPRVEAYLKSKGFSTDEMIRSSVTTTALKEQKRGSEGLSTDKVIGYSLAQSIQVRSKDVQKVAVVAREATELLQQGILIESGAPQFFCSSIGELKQQMLADAAKDAQLRAKKIAENTGSKIGPLRTARMGALQITPPNSTEVSDAGISDTSSIEKDITAVVNVSFAIE